MSKLTYERAKQLYTPYDEGQMRHLCALRDVEIDRLRAENAKLRSMRDTWQENDAKLRELVRLMWKPFCWAQSGYGVCLTDERDAEIRDKVRELGIEGWD